MHQNKNIQKVPKCAPPLSSDLKDQNQERRASFTVAKHKSRMAQLKLQVDLTA